MVKMDGLVVQAVEVAVGVVKVQQQALVVMEEERLVESMQLVEMVLLILEVVEVEALDAAPRHRHRHLQALPVLH